MQSTSKHNRRIRMATTTAVPTAASVSEDAASTPDFGNEMIKSEIADVTRWQKIKTDKQGQPVVNDSGVVQYEKKLYTNPSDKLKADLIADGFELVFSQPVVLESAGNPDGYAALITDVDERNGVFNGGYAQKRQRVFQKLFGDSLDTDDSKPVWEPTEEPYNPSKEMNEVTKRRNLTQDERTRRDLLASGYSLEVINIMFAAKAAELARKQQATDDVTAE